MTIYAFDTETHLIQPGNLTPRLVCVQTFCQDTDTKGKVLLRDEGIEWFRSVLSNGHSLIGHNAPFDLAVMAAASPDLFELIIQALEEGRIYCTQIRQMMIDNANGDLKFTSDEDEEGVVKPRKVSFSMQALAKRLLGVHVAKGEETWRLRYAELEGVPVELWPDDAREYAENDPKITSDLFFAQEYRRHDKRCDLLAGQEAQLFDFFALHMTAAWGLRTEKEAVDAFAKYIHAVYTEHANKAKEYGLITEFKGKNKRNMAAIKELVTASYNGDPPRTDKNNVSTNRETLTEANHPGLKAVADAVAAEKLLTTYLPVLRQGETVGINPRYTPILETFRTSCSSPNVQNLPRGGGVRECFVPRPGCTFAFCDYDTLELRSLAHVLIELFGHSAMAEALREGKDLHLVMASQILNMAYEQVLARKDEPEIEKTRQHSKPANFGYPGGMGANKFKTYAKQYGIILTDEESVALRNTFLQTFPEMRDYFKYCSDLLDTETVEGMEVASRIQFVGTGLFRGKVPYTAICNGMFQHLAAIGAKHALRQVMIECYIDKGTALYGCRPILFLHDEIAIEIPYTGKEANDAAERLAEVMRDTMKKHVYHVPITCGPVMMKRWFKGAKPVRLNGLLVPSKPGTEKGKWVADV